MCTLFDIPDSLLNDIFSGWMRETDLCRLDLAVCNHSLRSSLLIQLSNLSPIRVKMYVKPLRHLRMYIWLHVRGIRLRHLDIDEVLLDSWYDELLACNLTGVESVHFENRYGNNDYDAMLSVLVNNCPSLRGLSISGNANGGFQLSPVVFEQVTPEVWNSLIFLSLIDCFDVSMFVALGMCLRLSQLRSLTLDGVGDLSKFADLLRNNPKLTNMRLSGYFSSFHSLFDALNSTNRFLEAVSIAAENENIAYKMSDIAEVFRSNVNLTYFDMGNSSSGLTLSALRTSVRYYPDRADFADVVPLVKNRESILLDDAPISDTQLLTLASSNALSLESLHILDCVKITAAGCKTCLQICRRITQLKISVNSFTSEEWKGIFAGLQTSLKILQIKNRVNHDECMTCDVYASILLSNPTIRAINACPETVVEPLKQWCSEHQRKVTVRSSQ